MFKLNIWFPFVRMISLCLGLTDLQCDGIAAGGWIYFLNKKCLWRSYCEFINTSLKLESVGYQVQLPSLILCIGEWRYLIRPYLSVRTKQWWSSYKTHWIAGWYFFMTIVSPPFTCFWIWQSFYATFCIPDYFLPRAVNDSCEWVWCDLHRLPSSCLVAQKVFPVREPFLLVLVALQRL